MVVGRTTPSTSEELLQFIPGMQQVWSLDRSNLESVDKCCFSTAEPVLRDRPIGHENTVSQDRWSLVTGSITLKCRSFCLCVVFQDRWSLKTVSTVITFLMAYMLKKILLTITFIMFITFANARNMMLLYFISNIIFNRFSHILFSTFSHLVIGNINF